MAFAYRVLLVLCSFLTLILALAFLDSNSTGVKVAERADSSLIGYLFVHFYDREPSIFAHLSNGENPLSYVALNGDSAILKPTVGTKAARDPYLVSRIDQSMHWIIATDLDIVGLNNDWGQAVTHGSRSIIVWSSPDLVNWSSSILAQIMPATGGMVWAPEAIWDSSKNAFLVHWASRVFAVNDTAHSGAASLDQLWYSHTTDFITFTTAQPYLTLSIPVIDLTFLYLGGSEYVRFIKDENRLRVWQEHSPTGLFGTWNRIGGDVADTVTEGPLTFRDNVLPNRAYTFLDEYGNDSTAKGYVPFQTDDVASGVWTRSSLTSFPKLTKHGVVKPLNQEQYDAIKGKWAS